ncbi:MAG: hypothetical protein HYY17_06725 [Planctomycetes bacterium]|nr:hypothetical protein [Planctomycetota bacterium]
MARHEDPVVADVKRIRRKISRKLAAAMKKGRLYEEILKMDREADEILRNGDRPQARRAKAPASRR